jgi:hypothetical protein
MTKTMVSSLLDTTWVPCDTCIPEFFDQKLSYDAERYVEFFEILPASDDHYAEKYLNITDYLVWDGIDTFLDDADWEALFANTTQLDEIFTREKFYAPLEEQYGIFFENNAIVFQDNTTLPCGSDWVSLYSNDTDWCGDVEQNCDEYYDGYRSSCLYLYSWCQYDNIHQCFLYVDYTLYFSNDTSLDYIADLDYVWISLALKNNCAGANFRQGFVSLATVVLVIIGAFVILRRQNRLEEEFDEDEQTAQDYSIAIRNPPEDAYDPTEWKKFFESTFDNCTVRVCTVDVSNDSLVKLLVKRRELLQSLEVQLPSRSFENGKVLEEVEKARTKRNKSLLKCLSSGVPGLYNEVQEVSKELTQKLAEAKDRPTTNVFVTFETEEAQRRVLETLTVGSRAVQTNNIDVFSDPKYLFQGRLVLDVIEPEEPSTIRWQELDATMTQIVWSLIKTSLIGLVVLIVCWVVVLFFYLSWPVFASYATTACTTIFPMVATRLMGIEVHKSESSRQTWLFIKVTVFNVAITALLISVYTPFLGALENKDGSVLGLIPAVHALFFSQLVISPVIQLIDVMGTLKRHIFAPRAKTQEGMNMFMLGSQVNLAERYANLMKFIYLMLWFCAIYPAGLFMGSFALFVVYFTDRFSLMRSWARTPQLGTQISDFARNVFAPIAVVIMAVASNYWWSGFPYDNLCLDDRYTIHPGYVGARDVVFNATNTSFLFGLLSYSKPDYTATVTIAEDAQNYQFCNQDFRRYQGRSFPAIPKFQQDEWMTDDQTTVSDIYGWFSVAILALVLLTLFRLIGRALFSAYLGSYSPRGRDMKIPYSKCPGIGSYIPQVGSPLFAYPLLLCDISDVDTNLFNWTDPEKEHLYYDVTQDAKELLGEKPLPKHLFGRVKYWPLVAEDLPSVVSA